MVNITYLSVRGVTHNSTFQLPLWIKVAVGKLLTVILVAPATTDIGSEIRESSEDVSGLRSSGSQVQLLPITNYCHYFPPQGCEWRLHITTVSGLQLNDGASSVV